MQCTQIRQIYFSATGTTKAIVEELGKEFSGAQVANDLLRQPFSRVEDVLPGCLTIVGMPVYSGRVPAVAAKSLANLQGNGAPAIAVVAFGNREYDDALLELKNILEARGFVVIGAAAFIAQHSIFPMVATDRPDDADKAALATFARNCKAKLAGTSDITTLAPLTVKGKFPYVEVKSSSLQPTPDTDACSLCGACVEQCPTQALELGATVTKIAERCIACAACIAVCPEHAQAFRGELYEAYGKTFAEKCAARKEPEVFL